jgi:hypothetical protein
VHDGKRTQRWKIFSGRVFWMGRAERYLAGLAIPVRMANLQYPWDNDTSLPNIQLYGGTKYTLRIAFPAFAPPRAYESYCCSTEYC